MLEARYSDPCVENQDAASGDDDPAYKRFALPVLILSPPGPLAERESIFVGPLPNRVLRQRTSGCLSGMEVRSWQLSFLFNSAFEADSSWRVVKGFN